jgi:hypothetical protein
MAGTQDTTKIDGALRARRDHYEKARRKLSDEQARLVAAGNATSSRKNYSTGSAIAAPGLVRTTAERSQAAQIAADLAACSPARGPNRDPATASEFDVPLARGGLIALLMAADLSTPKSANRMFDEYRVPPADRPTLEQLRKVKSFLVVLDTAILSGDPRVWAVVQGTLSDFRKRAKGLAVAVAIESLKSFVRSRNDFLKDADVRRQKTNLNLFARKTRAQLVGVDAKFGTLQSAKIISHLQAVADAEPSRGRGKRSVYRALAELCIDANGALGAAVNIRANETREVVASRIANAFSQDSQKHRRDGRRKR